MVPPRLLQTAQADVWDIAAVEHRGFLQIVFCYAAQRAHSLSV